MTIKIDLTDVKTEFEPIPPGVYDATVADVEQKMSKKGNPYLNWRFSVEPNEDTGFDGSTAAWYITSLTKESLPFLKRTLSALGFSDEELDGELELDPPTLVGLECTLVVESEFYEGEERSRVAEVHPAGTVIDDASDEDMDIF